MVKKKEKTKKRNNVNHKNALTAPTDGHVGARTGTYATVNGVLKGGPRSALERHGTLFATTHAIAG